MRKQNRQNYAAWISQYRWRLWCVFTFRSGIRKKAARRKFAKWISDVELNEGRKLSWLSFPEYGNSGALHFHVLIAGIGSRIYHHVRYWNSLAGHCHVVNYDPRHPGRSGGGIDEHRGLDYAIKSLRSDDYEFDGQLRDEHLLPRFREVRR